MRVNKESVTLSSGVTPAVQVFGAARPRKGVLMRLTPGIWVYRDEVWMCAH
jgi:hypothetical protein